MGCSKPCSKCKSLSCQCNCVPVQGVPYYLQADTCQEDHTQTIVRNEFTFGVCSSTGWNIPLIGGSALIAVDGLRGAVVGAYLWHETFGYFKITSVDGDRNVIGITNLNNDGNAAPGTQVPACTCFLITDPPVSQTLDNVCVAIDFTAPAVGVPTDITLTSSEGITAGDIIQIGSGFYLVQEVKPNNIITIVNEGDGIAPGTAVIAKDANGNFLFCIAVISTNPCLRDAEETGVPLVCNADGNIVPLGAIAGGSIVIGSGVSGRVQIKDLCEALEDQCCYQVGTQAIDLQTFADEITLVDGYFSAQLGGADFSIAEITTPEGCNWLIEAELDIGIRLDIDSGFSYHEIQAAFSPGSYPTFANEGRMVFTISGTDGGNVSPPPYPVTADTTLFNDIPGAAPLFSYVYKQSFVKCRGLVAGGITRDLFLFYRMLEGQNNPISTVEGYEVQVSGIIKIFRV